MIGCYDFCGHYEWTFAWMERQGGTNFVREYWRDAVGHDGQIHARSVIVPEGIAGMKRYWTHTLAEEGAGYTARSDDRCFRLDMTDCPSKGFLLRNKLEQYSDYCDHCVGWIATVMKDADFTIDHAHNHCGQCWWEFRKTSDPTSSSAPGGFSGPDDVRLHPEWNEEEQTIDTFERTTDPWKKDRE